MTDAVVASLAKPTRTADEQKACPTSMSVRQGLSINVPVPGFTPDQISVQLMSGGGVQTDVVPAPGGSTILVTAPHGTPPSADAHIVITTHGPDGTTSTRTIPIIVSQIAVSYDDGDDDQNVGTRDSPFHTLGHAAGVARAGDTIEIFATQSGPDGPDIENLTSPHVSVPSGVTIEGIDVTTRIFVGLDLAGDVTFNRGRLQQRLFITAPGSHVAVQDMTVFDGITIASSAVGASLTVSGGMTEILSDDDLDSPVSVNAAKASVSLESQATIRSTGATYGTRPQIRMRDASATQSLTLMDITMVSSGNAPFLDLSGANTVVFQRSSITGPIDISAPKANATLVNTQFMGFGGLKFGGDTLMVSGCLFDGVPIEQSGSKSRARVQYTKFDNYTTYAYHLVEGVLDLGNATDLGFNEFTAGMAYMAKPTALVIDAPGTDTATVSATTFNGVSVEPCQIIADSTTSTSNGIYIIEQPGFTIDFY
ncbi:MAG TPA: hypothetical protein VHJ20_10710 [Polyangia bacterium]|nr:hypothetical protein [Polyangia bacterium]